MSLRQLDAKEVIKVLAKIGFVIIRQRGSHAFLKHPDAKLTREGFLS